MVQIWGIYPFSLSDDNNSLHGSDDILFHKIMSSCSGNDFKGRMTTIDNNEIIGSLYSASNCLDYSLNQVLNSLTGTNVLILVLGAGKWPGMICCLEEVFARAFPPAWI